MTPRHTILLLAVFNFLCWTLLPFLFERALRLDVAEAASFGSEYLFAYAKHPPLSFWLTALAAKWGSGSHLAIHALGASFAGVAHYILARYCLAAFSARIGIVAAIFGVVSPFATYLSIQFNHNVALMPFWAATLICALEAFEHNKTRDWLLLGGGYWARYMGKICDRFALRALGSCLFVGP